jgi:hypothetical protein
MNSSLRFTACAFAFTFICATSCIVAADKPASPPLKLHPKVFSMVDCWISDEEAPVVTEFNLDALEQNDDQFFADDVKKEEGGWTRSPNEDGTGFFRYRVLEAKDNRYKIEFQSNGGGTLTTAVIIDCTIDKREIKRDGKPKTIRVLRITGFSAK